MSQTSQLGKDMKEETSNNVSRTCSRWSPAEDAALVTSMTKLLDSGGWKADNGQFKSGAYAKLEELISKQLPGCDKKAKPNIESRVKHLRKQFDAITDMMNASGFGWNDIDKYVTCPQEVWDEWIKSHSNAAGLRNKPFKHYDELSKIWGKDRAAGNEATSVHDALEELEEGATCGDEQEVTDLSADDVNPTPQSEPMGPTSSTPQSATTSSSRTKRARNQTIEVFNDFSAKLAKINEFMEVGTQHIGRIANSFEQDSDSTNDLANKRHNVANEVMKMPGLTNADIILASKKIALHPAEVEFFFSLTPDLRYTYVQSLLLPDA